MFIIILQRTGYFASLLCIFNKSIYMVHEYHIFILIFLAIFANISDHLIFYIYLGSLITFAIYQNEKINMSLLLYYTVEIRNFLLSFYFYHC